MFGLALAVVYLAIAACVVHQELQHPAGGWISLRGMGTFLVTLPSQLTIGWLLRQAGVRKVDFAQPGWRACMELAVHVLATAVCLYGLGWALEHAVQVAMV